jgi:DNA modification methylase
MGAEDFTNYVEGGDWDFRSADTKQYTHCFHIYPAMMIPQIARELIGRFGKKGDLLFDPYCGTGTSLVEARIAGMNALGTDLNPTARFISLAKTRDYNVKNLTKSITQYLESIEDLIPTISDYSIFEEPEFVTWDKLEDWFPKKSIGEISLALNKIEQINYKTAQLFLRVALSECLRLVSFQRNGEFKQYRIPEEERKDFYQPLLPKLKERIERNLAGVVEFSEVSNKKNKAWIKSFNTVLTAGSSNFPGSGPAVDLVVTSPPYGDSGTTVAYAQFSWLSNVWLGLDDRSSSTLDSDLMGGRKTTVDPLDFYKMLECGPLRTAFENVFAQDQKRAAEVMQFYYDYYLSMKNVASQIKQGGHVCYVVGNRTVKNTQLPTDIFTAWAFEREGFEYIKTYVRDIPNKRMPSRNSPTNKTGVTNSTMVHEYIVVCRKN